MTTTRGAVRLGAVALGAVLVHVLGVVVPYVVNGLHHLPLAEVASGLHDPKDLWPATIPYLGGWLRLAAVLSIALAPLTLVFVLVTCGFGVGRTIRSAPCTALVHAVVAVPCVVVLAWFLGPTSQALISWQMD
ncbi:hypothetical protein ACI8AA_07015 [Geodermatophilus sp. SYSU D01180]